MFTAQAHSFVQQARLAVTLAWVAGYTNILTLLICAYPTSHVTGTLSNWGRHLVEARWGLLLVGTHLLGTFVLGAMVSTAFTEIGRRRGWESIYVLPIATQAALLSAFALLVEFGDAGSFESGPLFFALTGLASAAMGLQNATITRISSGVVRTTHMTGVLTDLGSEIVNVALVLADRVVGRREGTHAAIMAAASGHATAWAAIRASPSARRLALLACVAGSFAVGAALGAAGHALLPEYREWAMFPPVVFLCWLVYQDVRLPICEVRTSPLMDEASGLALPPGIAVFTLRKSHSRRSLAHRLPDLHAWSDRLPATTKVVILDLNDAAQLDAEATLELRTLVYAFERTGRRLIIAGVDRAGFDVMRRAGAEDLLAQHAVCPDLEIALARGISRLG